MCSVCVTVQSIGSNGNMSMVFVSNMFLLGLKGFYCVCFSRAVIGEIDEETDSTLDLKNIRAEPLNSIVH